jgi:hypothetical protein
MSKKRKQSALSRSLSANRLPTPIASEGAEQRSLAVGAPARFVFHLAASVRAQFAKRTERVTRRAPRLSSAAQSTPVDRLRRRAFLW